MTDRYAAYYCEENVWFLLQDARLTEGHAVFVINAEHSVALWSQRASPRRDGLVLWDYHVVALARVDDRWCVLDLDSTAGSPIEVAAWLEASFPFAGAVPEDVEPMFRVVPAAELFSTFRTDRSHMRSEDGWLVEPPHWPPLSDDSNLSDYLDVAQPAPGEVLDLSALLRRFAEVDHR